MKGGDQDVSQELQAFLGKCLFQLLILGTPGGTPFAPSPLSLSTRLREAQCHAQTQAPLLYL